MTERIEYTYGTSYNGYDMRTEERYVDNVLTERIVKLDKNRDGIFATDETAKIEHFYEGKLSRQYIDFNLDSNIDSVKTFGGWGKIGYTPQNQIRITDIGTYNGEDKRPDVNNHVDLAMIKNLNELKLEGPVGDITFTKILDSENNVIYRSEDVESKFQVTHLEDGNVEITALYPDNTVAEYRIYDKNGKMIEEGQPGIRRTFHPDGSSDVRDSSSNTPGTYLNIKG